MLNCVIGYMKKSMWICLESYDSMTEILDFIEKYVAIMENCVKIDVCV